MLRRMPRVGVATVALLMTSGLTGFGQDRDRGTPSLGFSPGRRAVQVEAETPWRFRPPPMPAPGSGP